MRTRARSEQPPKKGERFLAVSAFCRELGQDPCGEILSWGLYYSQVLTQLSDLSQGLKGILFGFKIFSLFEILYEDVSQT